MRQNYPKPTLPFTLLFEGGNDDDPRDPGGRTGQGIIQREYDAYRRRKGLPLKDVWTMSDDERDDIYRTYWDAVRGDDAPDGVDMVTFDGGVNSGPPQQTKWTQRTLAAMGLYADTVDGFIGNHTLAAFAAITTTASKVECVKGIIDRRTSFLQGLKTFVTFGKGWLRRTTSLEAAGVKLVYSRAPNANAPDTQSALNDHADQAKAQASTATTTATATATGGVATGGATVTPAPDVVQQVDPQALRALLIVGAIALVIAAVVYGYRALKHNTRATAYRNAASAGGTI